MSFVNIGLLAGGLFIAVPIALHLIMRQQPKLMEFPAIRFLRERQQTNTRRLRLRHLLLLALRVAAICLLALALARPSLQSTAILSEEAPVAAALVFDNSPRMDYEHRNQTRLQVAQEMAAKLLTKMPGDSQVAVVDGQTLVPAFAVDLGMALRRTERLQVSPVTRPLPELIEDSLEKLEEVDASKLRRELYVFTDLSKASWQETATSTIEARLEAAEEVGIYIIDVGVEEAQNFGLGELRLSRELLARNGSTDVAVDLLRTGPDEQRNVELYLVQAGRERKLRQQTADWSREEIRQVEFSLPRLELGTHQGVVRILGEDALPWDDAKHFTVEVRDAWKVLIAAARPEDAVYLTEAIAPSGFREEGRSRFECEVIDIVKIDQQRLGDYAAVCLLDPPPLAEQTWEYLARYAQEGGALATFLGRNAQLEAFNADAAQTVLPGRLRMISRLESWLAPTAYNHPILAKFEPIKEAVPWRDFPVFKYWLFDELDEAARVILPYGSRYPALIEEALGAGVVLTMTTPVSDPANDRQRREWNQLPTGFEPWPFVMLANETMLYLVGSQEEQLNYRAGDRVLLEGGRDRLPPIVLLQTPDGNQDRRTVDPRENVLEITTTDQVGNYRVVAGGREAGIDRGFSVNVGPEVSRLERLEPEGLDAVFGEDGYRLARNPEEIEGQQERSRVGQELFPYLMAILAAVLACEHFLANRFYRREA